jgi:transposase
MNMNEDQDTGHDAPTKPGPVETEAGAATPEASPSAATPSKAGPQEEAVRRRRGPPRDEPTAEERAEIVELHRFYGTRRIRPRVGRSRKVVRRVLEEAGELHEGQRPATGSKLVPYRRQIEEQAAKGLTSSRILREIRQEGYGGGRTILATLVHDLKLELAGPGLSRVKRRFETAPGVEMQIDWSPYKLLIGGVLVAAHALGCLLCNCRKLFVAFFRDERVPTLLEGLARAFEYFGGCAQRVVLDNMATAVLCRIPRTGKPILHPRFADFAKHYGFQPYPCKRRDPNRKGKKEKSFRLVWDDLLKGSEFESWADLDRRRAHWLDHIPETGNLRVHGTTREIPNEAFVRERDLLIRLPAQRFPVGENVTREVDLDSTLSIHGTTYTVPAPLADSTVAVRLCAEHFEVLDRDGRVAFSRRYVEPAHKGKLQIDPTHYASLPVRPRGEGGGQRIDEAFLRRFPQLETLVCGIRLRFKALAHVQVNTLLRLLERYGETHFLAAAHRAQDFRRFDATAIARILEQDHPVVDDEPVPRSPGLGPRLLGEVESGSLDGFGRLDSRPASSPRPGTGDARAEQHAEHPDPTRTNGRR